MSELNRNGPALWKAIMDVVGTHWQPVVAGGACRDFLAKREPKDIDVFVPADCPEDFTSIIASLDPKLCHGRGLLYDQTALDGASEYLAGEETECFGVWEGEIIGVPVNIVGRKSLQSGVDALIKTFDFGINQVAYQEGVWACTEDFWWGISNNMWTLAHDRTYKQSLERFDRINERHGHVYTLSIPEELLQ